MSNRSSDVSIAEEPLFPQSDESAEQSLAGSQDADIGAQLGPLESHARTSSYDNNEQATLDGGESKTDTVIKQQDDISEEFAVKPQDKNERDSAPFKVESHLLEENDKKSQEPKPLSGAASSHESNPNFFPQNEMSDDDIIDAAPEVDQRQVGLATLAKENHGEVSTKQDESGEPLTQVLVAQEGDTNNNYGACDDVRDASRSIGDMFQRSHTSLSPLDAPLVALPSHINGTGDTHQVDGISEKDPILLQRHLSDPDVPAIPHQDLEEEAEDKEGRASSDEKALITDAAGHANVLPTEDEDRRDNEHVPHVTIIEQPLRTETAFPSLQSESTPDSIKDNTINAPENNDGGEKTLKNEVAAEAEAPSSRNGQDGDVLNAAGNPIPYASAFTPIENDGDDDGEVALRSKDNQGPSYSNPPPNNTGNAPTASIATNAAVDRIASTNRHAYLHSQTADKRDVVRGLAPNPLCYTHSEPSDLDLEAEDAMRNKHATFVRGLSMRRVDLKDYVYSMHAAVESERIDKQARCHARRDKNLFAHKHYERGLFSAPLTDDTDTDSDAEFFDFFNDDDGTNADDGLLRGSTTTKNSNPFRLVYNFFANLCCFGNRMCCHFKIMPLAGELTHDNCRSPLLCALILFSTTMMAAGTYTYGIRSRDDTDAIRLLEPFVPLASLYLTVSGSGPIAYLIGLAGSSFSVYRAVAELVKDEDAYFQMIYTHLIFCLATTHLAIVAFIGLSLLLKLCRTWCADCIQSLVGSVDGEEAAVETFLYSRRVINWRPPLCVSQWKSKLRRHKEDPGRYNRYPFLIRFVNSIIEMPIFTLPVKLDWLLPPQTPDTDTRPCDQIPILYTVGFTLISILILAAVGGLVGLRTTIHNALITFDEDQGTSFATYFDAYIWGSVAGIVLVMLIILCIQIVSLTQVVTKVRKGGCNGSMDPKVKLQQLRSAAPYRSLDAVPMLFFTFCILLALTTIAVVFAALFITFLVMLHAEGEDASVFSFLTYLGETVLYFIATNVLALVLQWVFFSRFLMNTTNLRHPRLFSLVAPIMLVFNLSTNFVRVLLSFGKSLITIPLMFVLPFSYSDSPLHNPLMAIIFFNEDANNNIKAVMTAYFLARTQMQQIIFLGENYGIRSGSFIKQRAKNEEPTNLHASVDVDGHLPGLGTASVVPANVVKSKTKVIYVSLKVFGASELYQSQRNLIRLWVLLDYFPERFPRSQTPSISINSSLEKTIFEELLEYVNWVLEPRPLTIEAQILDKSPHYHDHRERDGLSNVNPAIRDLWRSTDIFETTKRTYRKEIVTMIMVAHGLIVTAESLKGVGDDTAARMVAVTSPRPYCYLAEVNALSRFKQNVYATSATRDLKHDANTNTTTEPTRLYRSPSKNESYEVLNKASALTNDREIDDEKAPESVRMLSQYEAHPSKPILVINQQQKRFKAGNSPYKSQAEMFKERREREQLRKASRAMFKRALTDFYEILEEQHQTRLKHWKTEEHTKKAWLINALEHPDSILIPVRIWSTSETCSSCTVDYILPAASEDIDPTSLVAKKGKLLGAAFLASISPKCPKLIARDRACWRWRLALTLMLYPSLQRERKHYLRLNNFTPAKPLKFNPTAL